jgi:hypothetical protein
MTPAQFHKGLLISTLRGRSQIIVRVVGLI